MGNIIMAKLSKIYNVIRNKKGKAKEGYIRATIAEKFGIKRYKEKEK
jgi:hypothetical protein